MKFGPMFLYFRIDCRNVLEIAKKKGRSQKVSTDIQKYIETITKKNRSHVIIKSVVVISEICVENFDLNFKNTKPIYFDVS